MSHENPIPQIANVAMDLDSIQRRGTLVLLTENSSSTYFQYRNTERGYDYEAVRAFALAHDLKLEVKVVQDLDEMFGMLMRGEGDIIASNMTITANRNERMSFSKPLYTTRQMLVQHKPSMMGNDTVLSVSDSTMLENRTIHVHRYSAFQEHLLGLNDRLDLDLVIENSPGVIGTGEMIQLVNNRTIALTVTDENLVHMDLPLHDSIDASVPISEPQPIAWAVRQNAPLLLQAINAWMEHEFTQLLLQNLYIKYFTNNSTSVALNHAFELPPIPGDSISPYDTLFRRLAPQIGWDWKFLAALAYQESGFNAQAVSWSGAKGLMQLMPETGNVFGCDSLFDAPCNANAAIECIRYLQQSWGERIRNTKERDKFVLASYNIGQGHIFD
ncbi:MAG: transglycosylase SLT domain-containing protein, partial [Flavobacteriales bacterium]